MSVQAMSRITALLALDAELLRDYVPRFAADDYDQETDQNESKRAYLAHLYRHQLTSDESDLVAAGDLNATALYIADHLEKPINGESTEGGGG